MRTQKIRLFFFSLFFAFGISFSLFSQTSEYYKAAYNQGFTLRPYLYYNVYGMQIESPEDTSDYATNNPLGIGIGLSHPKLPVGISVGYGIKATLNPKQVRTKSLDIQAHTYGRKYVFDALFQRYKGFYVEDFEIDTEKKNMEDLYALSVGVVGQYIFNHKKFSYRAAYNQKEIQLKSAGSFLVGCGLYFFNVKSPNFAIYGDYKRVRNFQIGLNGGYAYNWVIQKWLLNASLSGGANLGNGNLGTPAEKKLFLKPTALARISVFRNAERWSVGIAGVYSLGLPIYTKDVRMKLHSGRFHIVYLYRFGKIKKRKKSSTKEL